MTLDVFDPKIKFGISSKGGSASGMTARADEDVRHSEFALGTASRKARLPSVGQGGKSIIAFPSDLVIRAGKRTYESFSSDRITRPCGGPRSCTQGRLWRQNEHESCSNLQHNPKYFIYV